jgi:DNA-binding transcriptional LysR family regulator
MTVLLMGQLEVYPQAMMDLDDVRIFTKVAELGSFTGAAKQLDMPKSTVSRRVAELEDRLQVRLLQRSTRKLTLTHAGELYFVRTSRALEELVQAENDLAEMQNEPRGLLRITVPGDMSGLLSAMIQDFQRKFPLVEISLFSTGRRVDLIAEGYDLALRAGVLQDSSLVSRKLLDSPVGIYASPAYLVEHGEPQTLADLSNYRCLCFGTDRPQNKWKLKTSDGLIEIDVTGNLCSNDYAFLISACSTGAGIGFLPTLGAERLVRSGLLTRLFPNAVGGFGGLYAVYPSPRHLSPKVRAFIDSAAEWLAKIQEGSC